MKTARRTPRALASALAADAPVTAFIAPAGYGKSTAARALAAHYGNVATVDCSRLQDARSLRDAIAAADETEISTLLLENAEALLASSGAVEVLAERLHGARAGARVILCSRVHLPFGGRRVDPGSMHAIGPEELALDDVEVRNIFLDNGATDDEAQRAVQLARGWPMAVAMLARCARSGRLRAVLDATAGAELRELIGYLTEDALAALDDDALSVLRVVSLIPGARIDDLEYAFGRSSVHPILDGLAASPFVRRDGSHIEVHPLVQMALTHVPHEHTVEAIAAAARAQEASMPARAAELFLCSGSADDAARVLQTLGPEALRVGNVYARLLEQIDPDVLVRYPVLWMSAEQSRNQSVTPAQHVAECHAVLRNLGRCSVPSLRAVIVGIVTSVFDETMNGELASELLERARADARDDAQASLIAEFFTELHDAFRDRVTPADALRARFASLLLIPEMRFSFEGMIAAKAARIRGDADEERASLVRAFEAAAASQMPALVPLAHLELAYFFWRVGESDRSARHLDLCELTLSDTQVRSYAPVIACARGLGDPGTQAQPRLRMYASIMGSSRTADPSQRANLLRGARDIARGLGQRVDLFVAELALAFSESSYATSHVRAAAQAARDIGAAALADAVDAGDASLPIVANVAAHFRSPEQAERAPLAVRIVAQRATLRGADAGLSGRKFELLAMLALARRAMTGAEIAATVWPDLSASAARNSLGVTISSLRAVLGRQAIAFDKNGYRLDMRADVDVNRAQAVAKRVRAARSDSLSGLDYFDAAQAAADLESLDGSMPRWEWFAPTVARLQALRRDLLLALARSDFKCGEYEAALARLHALVAIDPCDEGARVLRIKVYLARNDRARAFSEYREYARTLQDELQIEPAPDVLALVRSA